MCNWDRRWDILEWRKTRAVSSSADTWDCLVQAAGSSELNVGGHFKIPKVFQFSEKLRRKKIFKTEYVLGWAGHKAVLSISWCGKGRSSLPQQLVISLYLKMILQQARSDHMSGQNLLEVEEMSKGSVFSSGRLKVCALCQLRCESKHNGQPRQSGRAEPGHLPIVDLAVLGASPAHLCKVLAHSHYKGQWDLNLLSLVLLDTCGRGCHFSSTC